MPNTLFDVKKVGIFCDAIAHTSEKRQDGETKVVQLTLRVQPFDAKLAAAVRQDVRQTLFKLNTVEAQPHIDRVNFKLGVPRQDLELFASSDTRKASILLQGCKVSGVYARTEKDANMLAFVFKVSFGPASRDELEYVEDWRNGQRWVSFKESDPSLQFEEVGDEDDDEAETTERPRDMWEEGDEANPHRTAADGPRPGDAAAFQGDTDEEPEPARKPTRRHADPKAAQRAKQAGAEDVH